MFVAEALKILKPNGKMIVYDSPTGPLPQKDLYLISRPYLEKMSTLKLAGFKNDPDPLSLDKDSDDYIIREHLSKVYKTPSDHIGLVIGIKPFEVS